MARNLYSLYTNTYNFKTKETCTDIEYVPNESSKIALYDNSNSIKSSYQHKMMHNSNTFCAISQVFQNRVTYNIHDVKMQQSDLLVAHYADAGMMGTSNDTRVTYQNFWKI